MDPKTPVGPGNDPAPVGTRFHLLLRPPVGAGKCSPLPPVGMRFHRLKRPPVGAGSLAPVGTRSHRLFKPGKLPPVGAGRPPVGRAAPGAPESMSAGVEHGLGVQCHTVDWLQVPGKRNGCGGEERQTDGAAEVDHDCVRNMEIDLLWEGLRMSNAKNGKDHS